jgi:multisubunit Na+/H+ antiporter MnhC subunit
MELTVALGIGTLAGAGVWLILRPRTFQVIIGLSLLSYAVNLFIIVMGRLQTGAPVLASRALRSPRRSIAAPARSGSTIGTITRWPVMRLTAPAPCRPRGRFP